MRKVADTLREVYEVNIRDAEGLIKAFKDSGDMESLRKAEKDLRKWQTKQRELEERQGA